MWKNEKYKDLSIIKENLAKKGININFIRTGASSFMPHFDYIEGEDDKQTKDRHKKEMKEYLKEL